MKAIVQDEYGQADVLHLAEIEKPAPADGEVLVRIRAAGVDPSIWHTMAGEPYLIRFVGFGMRRPKERVKGHDVAGVVEAVGAGVTEFAPGDEVFGSCGGAFAEYGTALADRFALKPTGTTFEEAAATPTSGFTALQALRDRGRLRGGQRVLVIGAGGGVGSFAVQLAKSLGAHVTGLCSTDKVELVRSIGADEVVDYTVDDITDGAARFDLIVDTAGNRPLARLRRILEPEGTIVLVGGENGSKWTAGIGRQLRAQLTSPFTKQTLTGMLATRRPEDLRFLAGQLAAGALRPAIDRTFPLEDAADAIRYLAEGHTSGKTVVTVGAAG